MVGLSVDTEPSGLCISSCHDILCNPEDDIQIRIRGCSGIGLAPYICPRKEAHSNNCKILGRRCPELPVLQ